MNDEGNHIGHGIRWGLTLVGITAAVCLSLVVLLKFERPPIVGVQRGFRGTGADQIYNPRTLADLADVNKFPGTLPEPGASGPKAATVYKNVKVLGGLSVGQFTRLMVSITQWVAPKQGCAYCHNVGNMADDVNYTKIVARRMIQMTQNINANWTTHVQGAGVVCYTCHRGNPVPSQIWFENPGPMAAGGYAETQTGMTHPIAAAGYTGLAVDPFTPFLEHDYNIREQGVEALPDDNRHSIKETEWTYALMMHFSTSLGVNCTYCHNSRAFGNWAESSPTRVVAWYGIRMVRDLNNNYLNSLADVFPAARKGPTGDVAKINCATCHQGVYQPLYGTPVIKNFPELAGPTPAQTADATPAEAPAAPQAPPAATPPEAPPAAPAPQ